jgi:uncharacterized protein (DUF1697 family)
MALVVLLRGVNVGTGRRFRPAGLAAQLRHLDAVNIGAAGTLVIRRKIARARLRAELLRRLPFVTEILICHGREILQLVPPGRPPRGAVAFVSVLSRVPRKPPPLPLRLPPEGRWLVKVLGRDGRYIFGLYRRDMKVIGLLGRLDKLFGAPATTRNWNTLAAVAKVLVSPRA